MKRLMTIALAGLIATSCADPDHRAPAGADRGEITGGAASLGGLAESIVAAISTGDTLALESFRLTQQEHNTILWPEFPAAQEAEHPFPVELAWENIEIRNAAGLERILARLGGEPIRPAGVACPGEKERYETFTVLRDCRVTVVRPSGEYAHLQLFRSVVVRDGRYKIVRYEREL